jgi:hypothetical protein
VLSFCRANLNRDGELFISVPNTHRQLHQADPALFVHQHVNYFTVESLQYLLGRHAFTTLEMVAHDDVLAVRARPATGAPVAPATGWPTFERYQPRLDERLDKIEDLLRSTRTLVHGACNALNNIAGWCGGDFDLADNDENKQGRDYFGRAVRAPAQVELSRYGAVLVMPAAYYDSIRQQYAGLGYTGPVFAVTTL